MTSATKTPTADRVILRCKRCKTVEAHEYMGGARIVPGTTQWATNERGLPITLAEDERCPSCRRYRTLATVKGHYNPGHACDARCMSAVGPACDCSCGGANHGRGHLS